MLPANGSEMNLVELVGRLCSLLDFERSPRSKAGWFIRIAGGAIGVIVIVQTVRSTAEPLLAAKPPPVIPTQEFPGDRFRLSEDRRKEIFKELATAELSERKRAIDGNTWQGHMWSREDDRGWWENKAVREAALRHNVTATQVYLVLDEGIRNHWLAPNGQPLPGNTPPLNIRSTW